MLTENSRNMVRAFFLRDCLQSLAKNVHYKPEHVHVIGAGIIGGDIATWCALYGICVTL